ncbi:MAG: radical SAM protein, partial [Clostridia bacterium]|nr:radical SAM protein [Clostridia bacterium]
MSGCTLCPRLCGARREAGERGVCAQGAEIRVARAALHPFEEPCISGSRGSGTVFFVGCSLRCAFCQNRAISRGEEAGKTLTPRQLADLFLDLEAQGAHNINLVTPTHFADGIGEALAMAKTRLSIPVVWNSSGYERVETLRRLVGLVDVYMPDFKYASASSARRYSDAADYPAVAEAALIEMYRQVGCAQTDADGLLRRGLLVRHLVLPGNRQDSMAVLTRLSELLPVDGILLSLMSQYTPEFATDSPHRELHRPVTTFEYQSVLSHAEALGFNGFMQHKSSASSHY